MVGDVPDPALVRFLLLAFIDPDNSRLIRRAQECWESGRYQPAINFLEGVKDAGYLRAFKWFTIAIGTLKLHKHQSAFVLLMAVSDMIEDHGPDLVTIIPMPGDDPDLQFALGYVLLDLDRLEEAHAAFQKSIRVRPDDPQTVYHLGLVFVAAGDQAAAREQYVLLERLDDILARQLYDKINF